MPVTAWCVVCGRCRAKGQDKTLGGTASSRKATANHSRASPGTGAFLTSDPHELTCATELFAVNHCSHTTRLPTDTRSAHVLQRPKTLRLVFEEGAGPIPISRIRGTIGETARGCCLSHMACRPIRGLVSRISALEVCRSRISALDYDITRSPGLPVLFWQFNNLAEPPSPRSAQLAGVPLPPHGTGHPSREPCGPPDCQN